MFHRIAALIKKEFYAVLRDPKSRKLVFVAPFMMLLIFSFAIIMDVKDASMGVLNLDEGDIGQQFTSFFSGSPTFTKVFQLEGIDDIKRVIDNQEAIMVLHIPEDFSKKLITGKPVTVQVILDGRKTNAANIVNGYAAAIAGNFGMEFMKRSPAWNTAESENPRINISPRFLFNPNLDYLWFTLPILLVILTQMLSLMVSGLSIARERELGTFEQLLVSPLSSTEIIIGKAVPSVCIAFGEGVVIHLIAINLFKIPFSGNILLLALSILIFAMSITGVGLFISSLSNTQQQAFLGAFTFMVPSVLLSGFAAPIENMPSGLQNLTYLNPIRHMISISLGLYLKNTPIEYIYSELCWLSGIATVTLTFATLLFKKKTQ
ncbi:MAG: ABC transporter permease [Synergistaceae bacterium]|nr:ABC transporter permease [Synergistaceae bacterium]